MPLIKKATSFHQTIPPAQNHRSSLRRQCSCIGATDQNSSVRTVYKHSIKNIYIKKTIIDSLYRLTSRRMRRGGQCIRRIGRRRRGLRARTLLQQRLRITARWKTCIVAAERNRSRALDGEERNYGDESLRRTPLRPGRQALATVTVICVLDRVRTARNGTTIGKSKRHSAEGG